MMVTDALEAMVVHSVVKNSIFNFPSALRHPINSLAYGLRTCEVGTPTSFDDHLIRLVLEITNDSNWFPVNDRDCTKRLVRASKVLGIRFLEHVIIGDIDYFSFAKPG